MDSPLYMSTIGGQRGISKKVFWYMSWYMTVQFQRQIKYVCSVNKENRRYSKETSTNLSQ